MVDESDKLERSPLAFSRFGLHTAALMPSELWQRLRAARRFADLAQKDIARAVGLTRSAVAQWEAAEPEHRTKPSVDHLMIVSRVTKAPLEWLLNDASRLEDLYKLAATNDQDVAHASDSLTREKPPDVLPDVRQHNRLIVFAQTPEQVAAKVDQLRREPPDLVKNLIVIGLQADVSSVNSLADALTLAAAKLS